MKLRIPSSNILVQTTNSSPHTQPKLFFRISSHCNWILMDAPNCVDQSLQRVQIFAATRIIPTPRHPHSTPLLQKKTKKNALASHYRAHWIQSCIQMLSCCKWFWSCLLLWTATCVLSVSFASFFFWFPHAHYTTIQIQHSWLSHFLLLWTPCLESTPTRPRALNSPTIAVNSHQ